MIYTTLELCKEKSACASGYKMLKKSLGQDHKDTDLIPLTHVIKSNGLQDAIWSLRATTEPCRDFITNYVLWCAEQVLDIYEKKYPDDKRIREYLEGVKKYQLDEISKDDLIILRHAAANATYTDYTAAAAYAYVDYAADAYAYADYAAYVAYAANVADAAKAAAYAYADADADDADMREAQKSKLIEMLNESYG